ncbi:hypothetical protein GCM10027168_19560 [Streptomyces capparidis]
MGTAVPSRTTASRLPWRAPGPQKTRSMSWAITRAVNHAAASLSRAPVPGPPPERARVRDEEVPRRV